MLLSPVLIILIGSALIFHFQPIIHAVNDDPTFDWLKEEDHIISEQDLQTLNKFQQKSTGHNNVAHAPHAPSIPTNVKHQNGIRVGRKRLRPEQMDEAKWVAKEAKKKTRRAETERNRLKYIRENYPLQHKAFQEKRNQNRRDKFARLTNEERQQYYKDTYAHKKKKKEALSAEEFAERSKRKRESQVRYKQKLESMILSNQATEAQVTLYRKNFGKKAYNRLLKEE